MIDKIKIISIPFAVFITALIIINYLVPAYHPFGGLKVTQSEDSILKKSKESLDKINIHFNEDQLNIGFKTNSNFTNWIYSENKLYDANRIISESGCAYYWNVNQKLDDQSGIVVSSNSNNVIIPKSNFSIKFLDNGKLIEFDQTIIDSVVKKSLSPEDAKKAAIEFIRSVREDLVVEIDSIEVNSAKQADYYFYIETETIDKPGRVDYNFSWQTKNQNGLNYRLKVKIVGDKISLFQIQPIIPDQYNKSETDIFEVSTTIILTLLIIISISIVGFKRFRAYEVGFKHAIIFGLFVLISFILKELLEWINIFDLSMILGLGLGGIFIAGASIILWAVSETIFREIWNPKFLSLDLIYHRKFIHSTVGKSILNGVSFGFGLNALFYLMLFLISNYSTTTFTGDNFTTQSHITANLPLLNILFGVFNGYAILAVSFFMFITAAIKRYISNDIIFVIVTGLSWALLVHSNVNPLTAGLPINLVIGILLAVILIKYDLLSTLISFLLFRFFIKATEFSFLTESHLHNQWSLLLGITISLISLGVLLIFIKDKFTDYDSITPKFVENITERQRLKKELDVARHVQMSFLPKENPKLSGIDISSICIPAFEVGGDYYDFIQLDQKKLGIIIGDVSGKGTQAAFYMTLTKGFLKALAKQTDSPAEVLTKMNELFYENVERGRFISMIYAIVDLNSMKIKIARAGHNPVIIHDDEGKLNLISPNGLALGLEKGTIFSKVITEHEEKLVKGQTFIFYTDGFTEAVNKKGEEYGLERMYEVAKYNNKLFATELQDKMIADINKFIGKAPQHDDMTMVILKIN